MRAAFPRSQAYGGFFIEGVFSGLQANEAPEIFLDFAADPSRDRQRFASREGFFFSSIDAADFRLNRFAAP